MVMMRSLALKVYAFSVLALVLVFSVSYASGRFLVKRTQLETLGQLAQNRAELIAWAVEGSLVPGPHGLVPAQDRMREIERRTHVKLRYLPLGQPGYPAELASNNTVAEAQTSQQHMQRVWVKLTDNGRPIGAILVSFGPPRFLFGPFHRQPPLYLAFSIMAAVGLVSVPAIGLLVIRPLRRMAAIAHRLGDGDLSTPVEISRSDEFGEFQRAFEGMRRRLEAMLASRERLLLDISHELRGPLSRMTIALGLIRHNLAANEKAMSGRYLDSMASETAKMESLISELLSFARGRQAALEIKAVDLAEIAAGLLEERDLILSERGLNVQLRLDPAQANGDRNLLARAMGNLLDNAINYTPKGGHIELVTSALKGAAVFRVQDDGPGIPAKSLPHLFEPFFRPDTARCRNSGGTGLGLAIASSIAQRHSGTATVWSEEGHGTLAELSLPARPA